MPSQLHEALLLLFRNRPQLAAEILRDVLHQPLPDYTDARIESAELIEIQPAEYRADLVVLLLHGKPVLGIVVEAQLGRDPHKRFAWPVYAVELRARIRCPVCVLVICADDAVARWCAEPIELGPGSVMQPLVLGPAGVPFVTDPADASHDPELAVLSAMAHGNDADPERALQIALAAMAASLQLDPQRSLLYYDLVVASLGEAARKALQAMDPANYEFQSEFAKRYLSEGRAEGRAEGQAVGAAKGRAAILLKQVTLKFGDVSAETRQRIDSASVEQLDLWAERILGAQHLKDLFR